jgi:hypothetical protein
MHEIYEINRLIRAINAEREWASRTKDSDLITPLETKLWRDLCKEVENLDELLDDETTH